MADTDDDGPAPLDAQEALDLAEQLAQATGEQVIIGVRPNGRGWYTHCGGVEYDGRPGWSVRSVVEEHQSRSERAAHAARRAAAEAGSVAGRLGRLAT